MRKVLSIVAFIKAIQLPKWLVVLLLKFIAISGIVIFCFGLPLFYVLTFDAKYDGPEDTMDLLCHFAEKIITLFWCINSYSRFKKIFKYIPVWYGAMIPFATVRVFWGICEMIDWRVANHKDVLYIILIILLVFVGNITAYVINKIRNGQRTL